ncbi:MAG: hypothetical protein H0U76_15105 [Ktedonobacteraceae bacterium]|nr:hypothetical protein [Ktedonobacteraceae bacterium]
MVPAEFETYFAAMAAVGATLFGLIFVAISITPESIVQKDTLVGRQTRASSAYNALLNPLVISLFALIPHAGISSATLTMSIIGLINTLFITFTLLPQSHGWYTRLRDIIFILSALIVYCLEAYYGLRLLRAASDTSTLYDLAPLLIVLYIFGIARAWALLGIRQFPTQDHHPHNDEGSA